MPVTEARFRAESRNILWTQLNVDTSYQRDLSPLKVGKIARVFDPDAFGQLIVGRRRDGTFWVIDGQHRWKAMQQMGWTDQNVPCLVLHDTTPEEEAELFDMYNGNRGMPRISDRFKARLRHHDEEAVAIEKIVNDAGFVLFFGRGAPPKNAIGAVSALLSVHQSGKPGDLFKVLTIIRESWQGEHAATNGEVIKAIHRFTSRYRDQFEMATLIQRLHGSSPSVLTAKGRQIAEIMGTTVSIGISRAILQLYNASRRTGRLPDWEGGASED